VAENQPGNKYRMNIELANFAARLRALISHRPSAIGHRPFAELARELFGLQFKHNPVYRKICDSRNLTPKTVEHWAQVPFVPTAAFKELELSSIPHGERTAVFHSSGTTEQKPSRHFHCPESLALYEASLWQWFQTRFSVQNECLFLTPSPSAAPRSSLVRMFETVRSHVKNAGFFGAPAEDGAWLIDFDSVVRKLKRASDNATPLTILGTAFSFVHLLDFLAEMDARFELPKDSRVMETGGYKNRSRTMPKDELHAFITDRLGLPARDIICEYGMSELSSQAYDVVSETGASLVARHFHFPPWARVQIISPETGCEAAEGETGLIRIFDLANVYSVAAIQTEDLGVRRGDGFELVGRAQLAEPRGCSLMTA
jgi:hypothetical protein